MWELNALHDCGLVPGIKKKKIAIKDITGIVAKFEYGL